MQEKDMVNDILTGVNNSLTNYANAITQSENPQLRASFQQIRNECENFQYELFKVAQQKGYYKPAAQADTSEVAQVKSQWTV